MIGAADAVKCLLGERMKIWITNLTANDECLGKVTSDEVFSRFWRCSLRR